MTAVDEARWSRLSPKLDELLELDEAARTVRLAELAGADPAMGAELADLLARQEAMERSRFLEGPPLREFAPATLAGRTVGAYTLERELGRGGMGTIWLARRSDGRYQGRVAVKFLNLALVGRAGAERFRREGNILARLSHPNIARLIDAGIAEGQPYLVLEYVEGEPIDAWCDARSMGIEDRIRLFRGVLAAVAHAHGRLVLHRDLKPSNILVAADGQPKLLDFGIAKLLEEGAGAGGPTTLTGQAGRSFTPGYAAPEQVLGNDVTMATDVYALGVTLFRLLAGAHPTADGTGAPADRLRALVESPAGRASQAAVGVQPEVARRRGRSTPAELARALRGDLDNILAKALAKTPEQRYPTCHALEDDLRRHLAHELVSARRDSIGYRIGKFIARHRALVVSSGLLVAAVVAGLIGTISQAHRATQQGRIAAREAESARRERDEVLSQQRLLRGTNEFLQLVLRDAANGDAGAIRRQLDRSSELVERTRFEDPIVKVALLRQISGRYHELGDLQPSMQRLRQAIASIQGTELASATSAVPVNLACSLARLLTSMGRFREALAEFDRADALMAGGAALSVPSQVECHVNRSLAEAGLGQFEPALTTAQEALRTLEAAGVRQGEQHRVTRSVLSRVLMESGRHVDGLSVAAPLLSESLPGQGRQSMAVVRRSSVVTSLTRLGGQPLLALPLSEADEASATALLGPNQRDAAIDLEHGLGLLALGRAAEASEVLSRSASQAAASGNGDGALRARLAATEALLLAGLTPRALEVWAAAEPDRLAAAAQGAATTVEALRVASLVARARGDGAAALQALESAGAAIEAGGGEAHPGAHAVALTQAEALLASGDAQGAMVQAERALASASRLSLDPQRSSLVGAALLARTRARSAAGQAQQARADARAAAAQLEATLGPAHPLSRQAAILAR